MPPLLRAAPPPAPSPPFSPAVPGVRLPPVRADRLRPEYRERSQPLDEAPASETPAAYWDRNRSGSAPRRLCAGTTPEAGDRLRLDPDRKRLPAAVRTTSRTSRVGRSDHPRRERSSGWASVYARAVGWGVAMAGHPDPELTQHAARQEGWADGRDRALVQGAVSAERPAAPGVPAGPPQTWDPRAGELWRAPVSGTEPSPLRQPPLTPEAMADRRYAM